MVTAFLLPAPPVNDIGVNRALGKPFNTLGALAFDLAASCLKTVTNSPPMIFAFGFRVADPCQLPKNKSLASAYDLGVQLANEHIHHHVAFVQTKQAVVHETQVNWSPIARWINAATDDPTPPNRQSQLLLHNLGANALRLSAMWSPMIGRHACRKCQHGGSSPGLAVGNWK